MLKSLRRSFSVVHEHRLQELPQNCARIKRFFKITYRYKTLKKHNKWEPAGRMGDFENILNGFAKSPQLIILNIDWVQFVLNNCEILRSVRGLYYKQY